MTKRKYRFGLLYIFRSENNVKYIKAVLAELGYIITSKSNKETK